MYDLTREAPAQKRVFCFPLAQLPNPETSKQITPELLETLASDAATGAVTALSRELLPQAELTLAYLELLQACLRARGYHCHCLGLAQLQRVLARMVLRDEVRGAWGAVGRGVGGDLVGCVGAAGGGCGSIQCGAGMADAVSTCFLEACAIAIRMMIAKLTPHFGDTNTNTPFQGMYVATSLGLVAALDELGLSREAGEVEAALGDVACIGPQEEAQAAEQAALADLVLAAAGKLEAARPRSALAVGRLSFLAGGVRRANNAANAAAAAPLPPVAAASQAAAAADAAAAASFTAAGGGRGGRESPSPHDDGIHYIGGPAPGDSHGQLPEWMEDAARELGNVDLAGSAGGLLSHVSGQLLLRPFTLHDVWLKKVGARRRRQALSTACAARFMTPQKDESITVFAVGWPCLTINGMPKPFIRVTTCCGAATTPPRGSCCLALEHTRPTAATARLRRAACWRSAARSWPHTTPSRPWRWCR